MQEIITFIILGLTVSYVVFNFSKQFFKADPASNECSTSGGGCNGCSVKNGCSVH
jgi:hypothetical protein